MGIELMPESEEDVSVQLQPANTAAPNPQPAFQPTEIKLDRKDVREAMRQAAENGVDPFSLSVGDLQKEPSVPEKAQVELPVDVPEKFKKPNGEVDVEKLQASTKSLDEAIQTKQQKLQDVNKVIEDQVRAYKDKYKQFRGMPNPEKVVQPAPVQPFPVPQQMTDQQLEEMIARDMQANPARTIVELVRLATQKELAPIQEDRKADEVRNNLRQLAERDVRVIENIALINAKLEADPDLWTLKNPHKAAWLEVKEDLRLGDVPNGTIAPPSKTPTPILGGGTPPPAPTSSSELASQDAIFTAAQMLGKDPRTQKFDPKAREAVNAAAKKFFDDLDRRARRT